MPALDPTRAGRQKIGLAMAGGGPEGAIYEVGALKALDESLEGLDFNDLDIYVGVSAGSFLASCLVNGLTPTRLFRASIDESVNALPIAPETFFRPATSEMVGRALMTPRLALEALADYMGNPADQSLFESLMRLTRALPVGLFDNEPIRAYLSEIFAREGRTDDFRKLRSRLVVVAADLDSGQAVRFGEPGTDHVPISTAVQASTALPGLYPPVDIEGRHYVDGVLLKTLHASVALDAGAKLLICINPIVPVDTSDAVAAGAMRRGKLIHRGLPTVLAQTFRTLVHSRMATGMSSYEPRYPDADLVLFEPDSDDYRMFFTNVFKFSDRRAVCEHAYQSTRRQLLARREELEPIFERHGIRMRVDVLLEQRRLVQPGASGVTVVDELDDALERLEKLLARQQRLVTRE